MALTRGSSFDDQSAPSPSLHGHPSPNHDAMEAYFTCITTCSLDDGSCITECVEEFRERQ
jgi:hypothetical protein